MKNPSLIILIFWICATPLIAQTPQWANTLGNINGDAEYANFVSIDDQGNVYSAGTFNTPIMFSDSQTQLSGWYGINIYIYKRSPSGELLWARSFNGSISGRLYNIAVDNEGNIYLVGQFRDAMAVGSGGNSVSLTSNGQRDGFIVKYAANGQLLAAHSFGGTSSDNITSIAFDNQNNLILAGYFIGEVDFDPGANTHIEDCTGLTFIKLTKEFELISVHKLNSYNSFITKLIINAEEELIFSGYFREYITTNSGEGISGYPESKNCGVVMKLSSAYEFEWATTLSGGWYQNVTDIAISESGDIFATGDFANTVDFKSHSETQTFDSNTLSGYRNIHFFKISPSGDFEWIKTIGGEGNEYATSIQLDNNGNIFLAGSYASTTDFDPGSGTELHTPQGSSSSYISIYTPDGAHANTITFENETANAASGIVLGLENEIYLTGWYTYSINFDSTQTGFDFTTTNRENYLMKLSSVIVGLPEVISAYPISIFPNPARDELHVEALHLEKIEVYNMHGKLVLSKANNTFGDRHTIEISHLPAGTYILSLTANTEFVRSEKFVVIR